MGTVHLTHSHHNLCIHNKSADLKIRVALEREVLLRPILDWEGEPLSPDAQAIVRAALQALLDLPAFDSAVSFRIKEKDGAMHLVAPHREWGEITLGSPENVVVKFSHDSRYENRPFRKIWQWSEDRFLDDSYGLDAREWFVTKWSSPELWVVLFKDRIKRTCTSLHKESHALYRRGIEIDNQLKNIQAALR